MCNIAWRRVLSGLLIFSLLSYSLLPYGLVSVAFAQEPTDSVILQSPTPSPSTTNSPSPTPTDSPNLTPTDTPTLTPTETPNPSPTVILSPTLTIDLSPTVISSVTPEPTTEVTSSPTPTISSTGKIPLRIAGDFLKNSKKQTKKNYVEGEVIVKFKKNKLDVKSLLGKAQAFVFEKKFSLEKKDEIKNSNIQVFKSKKSTEEMVKELTADSNVEYAEPNYLRFLTTISTNDTHKNLLWGLDNTGQTVEGTYSVHTGTSDKDIDAPEAWAISEGSQNVIVAVIDTGVAYNHPDLIANMWDGTNCKDENGATLGGCNHGYDFENNDKTPLPDNSSHGTHIAGTIAAAKNNSKGVIGVAPNTKIMALKIGFGWNWNIWGEAKAIDFAIQNGAKIINASFGGTNSSITEYDAINRLKTAGGIFVTSAGNCGDINTYLNNGCTSQNQALYPANHDLSNIISVAATDQNDNLATFSNYNATSVDVGAPGTNIYSTVADLSTTQLLNENFDNLTAPAVPSGWSVSSPNYWGTYYFGGTTGNVLYGDDYHYPYWASANVTITTPSYNLSSASVGTISFLTACDTEYTTSAWQDYMSLEGSGDGSNYSELLRWDEQKLDWLNGDSNSSGLASYYFEDIPITSNLLTSNFKLRFRWVTNMNNDAGTNGDGCKIDLLTLDKHSLGSTEKYDYMDGTSMATPHVAGLAALIEGYNSNLTSAQVKNIILTTGDNIAALSGKTVSGKRINAQKALQSANPAKAITSFTIPGQTGETVINESAHTIGITVPFGTNVSALIPTIVTTGASISPASGVAQNFTNPVIYTVTAADSSTQAYTVTVTVAANPAKVITSFTVPGQTGETAIVAAASVLDETFESVTPPNIPNGWTKGGTNNNWGVLADSGDWGNSLFGDISDLADGLPVSYADNANTTITSPTYNLNLSSANIDFYTFCETQYTSPTNWNDPAAWTDYMALEYSGDGGSNFTQVLKWNEPYLNYLDNAPESNFAVHYFNNLPIPSQYLTNN